MRLVYNEEFVFVPGEEREYCYGTVFVLTSGDVCFFEIAVRFKGEFR